MFAAFRLFNSSHLGALAVILAVTALSVYFCRKNSESSPSKICILLLIFGCFAAHPLNQWAWIYSGESPALNNVVPFHLCNFAAFFCGFALITRKPLLCELGYYWGLAGTLQGLLTPDIGNDFPDPKFIAFFLLHGAIVITALLLPLGLGWRPRKGAAWRAFFYVLLYACAAGVVNLLLGTNFGYLKHKPSKASLLDIMGPWPYYIICLIAFAGLLFFLLSLPFRKTKNAQ